MEIQTLASYSYIVTKFIHRSNHRLILNLSFAKNWLILALKPLITVSEYLQFSNQKGRVDIEVSCDLTNHIQFSPLNTKACKPTRLRTQQQQQLIS